MLIDVPANFSFPATVVSHGWYRLAPFQWSVEERVLRRVEALGGNAHELTIAMPRMEPLARSSRTSHSSAPALVVSGAPRGTTRELRAKIERMFQLRLDTAPFVALTRTSPAHDWVATYGFGRLLCGSTLFEDIVKIITTTNTTWQQTRRMVDRLVDKCGPRTRSGNAFPSAEDLLRYSESELQRECRLGYRAKSIHALARGIMEGTLDLDRISDPSQSTEELFASYRRLPGIGPYGAAHLLAMDGRHDFIAVDSEFRRYVRETYHKGRKVSDAILLKHYARWGRWKYLIYWSELWRTVADHLQPLKSGGQ